MRAAAVLALVLASGCNVILGIGDPHLADDDQTIDANPNAIDADPNAPDSNPNIPDADPGAIDAPLQIDAPSAGCTSGGTQCTNCIDDDGDGLTDGFDAGCTGAIDNDEGTFGIGIALSGNTLDCFFDADAGSGNDNCSENLCCLTTPGCSTSCNTDSQQCQDFCVPLTAPGCDCFGCCTVCSAGTCRDIAIDDRVSPGCDPSNPEGANCVACQKATTGCEVQCDNVNCILCPGQTVADLPGACEGIHTCPGGSATCTFANDCAGGGWCANGCCIGSLL